MTAFKIEPGCRMNSLSRLCFTVTQIGSGVNILRSTRWAEEFMQKRSKKRGGV